MGGTLLQNTVGWNFRRLKSLGNTWGYLHPLEAVTFWIASQVGKISNGVHLHMADSVHTPFVWREWFPPRLLADPSQRPQGRGSTQLLNLRFTCCVTASWLTTHVTLWFYLNSPAIYTRSPAAVCFFCSSFTLHAPPHHQFSSTLNSSKLQHISLSE